MRRRYYSSGLSLGCSITLLFVVAGICILSTVANMVCHYSDPHWETITVTEKNINPSRGQYSGEKWLVYTEEEVYCITDLLWAGFFTSSDVYNEIKPGKTYEVYVSGKRMPIISGYKVIREVREVKDEGGD